MQYSTTPAPRAKKVKKTTVKPIIVDLRVRSQQTTTLNYDFENRDKLKKSF